MAVEDWVVEGMDGQIDSQLNGQLDGRFDGRFDGRSVSDLTRRGYMLMTR